MEAQHRQRVNIKVAVCYSLIQEFRHKNSTSLRTGLVMTQEVCAVPYKKRVGMYTDPNDSKFLFAHSLVGQHGYDLF